jgi:hypothetical protein
MTGPIDLHELMTAAVDPIDPGRPPLAQLGVISQLRRRRRRVVVAVTAALVVCAIGGTAIAGRSDRDPHIVGVGPASSGTGNVPVATAPSSKPAGTLPGGRSVPNLVGLSIAQAQQVLPAGVGSIPPIVVAGETVDQSALPGTVVAQSPAAGNIATQVSITIAVPQSAVCTKAQLALTYLGGGAGAGSDSGTVVARNVSDQWCTFSGPALVVGLDRTARAVTQSVTYPVTPFALSPGAGEPPHGQQPPANEIEANVVLSASYRDGPQPNGLCDTMQIIPATWQLTLPGPVVLTVRNDDPQDPLPAFRQLITCQGQMNNPTPIQLASP